ncbi:MAG TPA: hypothetical protein VNM43_03860 [Dehalococcoidia bacterium]|nr:hypothetical protein [Dehalococcoidia bacterium]
MSPSEAMTRRAFALAIAAAVGLGFLIRAQLALSTGFPLNDGGLFYAMMGDVHSHGYRLPEYTSYNGGDIPFAYPPLALYVGAALADLTPLSTLDVLRFLPLVVNTTTVVAFALLARSMLGRNASAVAATVAFALLPRSFLWMVMGGGLTRSLGFFFAVLGAWLAHRTVALRERGAAWWLGLVGGLAALAHLEMVSLLFVAVAVMAAFQARDRITGARLLLSLGILVAVTAPWWLVIVARHGFDPFWGALRSNGDVQQAPIAIFRIVRFQVTGEVLFPLILLVSSLGLVTKVARREFMLPVWLVVAAVVDLRSFPMYATLPVALLAGVGWATCEELIRRAATSRPRVSDNGPGAARLRRVALAVLTVVVLQYAWVSALVTAGLAFPDAVDAASREAMSWIEAETPPSSRFAVVSGNPQGWALDEISEWFPALTGRRSVATVQGSEWQGQARRRLDQYTSLQRCAFRDADCLAAWSERWGIEFDYVYVAKGRDVHASYLEEFGFDECCSLLRASLLDDPDFRIVYDGPSASVFQRVRAAGGPEGERFLTPSEGHR